MIKQIKKYTLFVIAIIAFAIFIRTVIGAIRAKYRQRGCGTIDCGEDSQIKTLQN